MTIQLQIEDKELFMFFIAVNHSLLLKIILIRKLCDLWYFIRHFRWLCRLDSIPTQIIILWRSFEMRCKRMIISDIVWLCPSWCECFIYNSSLRGYSMMSISFSSNMIHSFKTIWFGLHIYLDSNDHNTITSISSVECSIWYLIIWCRCRWFCHPLCRMPIMIFATLWPVCFISDPDSKVHGANMGPTWVLSAPDGPHVGPMNLAIRRCLTPPPRATKFSEVLASCGYLQPTAHIIWL